MANKIFVNLPVKNLDRSKDFYTKLGFTINQNFTDDTAACVVITEDIYVMILTEKKFKDFTPKAISDATKTTEVLNALSFDNKQQVDEITEAAIAAGGGEARPASDLGFMYSRSFNDPDGHIWEPFWMDDKAAEKGPQPA